MHVGELFGRPVGSISCHSVYACLMLDADAYRALAASSRWFLVAGVGGLGGGGFSRSVRGHARVSLVHGRDVTLALAVLLRVVCASNAGRKL